MSSKRPRLAGLLVAAGLVAVGLASWLTRPSAYRAAYDTISLKMAEADLLKLAPAVARPLEHIDEGGKLISVDWEGQVNGQAVTFHARSGDDPGFTDILKRSRLFPLPTEPAEEDGRSTYRDRVGGPAGYTRRLWLDDRGRLAVVTDAAGRVIEKVYARNQRVGPLWWERVRAATGL